MPTLNRCIFFLYSASVLSFHIDVVLTISIGLPLYSHHMHLYFVALQDNALQHLVNELEERVKHAEELNDSLLSQVRYYALTHPLGDDMIFN